MISQNSPTGENWGKLVAIGQTSLSKPCIHGLGGPGQGRRQEYTKECIVTLPIGGQQMDLNIAFSLKFKGS